jgi:RHS repeat-associated protein
MAHSHSSNRDVPVVHPRSVRLVDVRRLFTWSILWRLFIAFLMCSLYVLGAWSTLTSRAPATYAASQQQAQPLSSKSPRLGTHAAASISACPALTGTPKVNGTVDGLGALGFYTLVKQRLDDRLQLATNVANGNLVAQYTALQIHGTGLDLDIALTYNSQSSASGVLGANWNLSVGNDVSLSFNGNNATLHGSSGFSAPYTADTSSYGNYDEPPGLDATLLKSTVNGASYVLIFQKTNECFGFNSSGQEIFDQDKNGHQITFTYNGSGNISSLTDTQNRVTTFGYNSNGRINLITDPIGRTLQPHYQNGLLTSIVDLNGKTTTLAYTSNDLTSITDPDNNVTGIGYQASGNRVNEITDALTNHAFVAYYSPGASQCGSITSFACTVFTDANNHTTIYGYNGLEVQDVVDGNGNMEQNSYTSDANISQYTDALGDLSVFNFDVGKTNNLLSTTDGSGAKTTFGYTDTNPYLPTALTDPQSRTKYQGYDSNGNMTSAKDTTSGGTGSSATYSYNTSVAFGSFLYGTLVSTTDGDGNVTSYSYDSVGNLKTVMPPSPQGQQSLTVDGVSRVTSVTDGRGKTTSFTYDNLDRLTKITYNNGGTITYTYDANGNEMSLVDNTGTTNFTYDGDNRILTKTLPSSLVITSSYDPVGNLKTFNDGGGAVNYDYDNANRVTKVEEPDGSITSYGYNNANEKTSISYPNSTGVLFTYDKTGHVTSAVGGVLNAQGQITTTYSSFTYSYLAGSTPTNLVQSVKLLDPIGHVNSFTRDYSYDSMNRLTNAEVFNSSNQEVQDWGYSYDKAGNRLKSTVFSSGSTMTYSYNGANELTQTVQGSTTVTYSYDGNGNQTGSSTGPSFTYNDKNQTTAIGSNSYTYSGPSQVDRVKINALTNTYSSLGLTSQSDTSGTTYYTRCSCGLLVNERLPNGSKYYYLFDGLGSIVGLTNSSGSEVNAYDYDPYGVILNETTPQPNPFQYVGGYFESSTGLVKFGTRYYNPSLGRWTQQDPVGGSLGNPDTLNRYVYASDDSVNETDPSGRQPCGVVGLDLQPFFTPLGLSEYFFTITSDLGPIVSVIGVLTWYGGIFPGAISLDTIFAPPFLDFEQLNGVIPTGTGNITVIASGLVFLEDGTVCGFLVQGTFPI